MVKKIYGQLAIIFRGIHSVALYVGTLSIAIETSPTFQSALKGWWCSALRLLPGVSGNKCSPSLEYLPTLIVLILIILLPTFYLLYLIFSHKYQNYRKLLWDSSDAFHTLVRESLKNIFLNLGFTNNERISVYWYDESTKRFDIVGRYSSNPYYNDIGRESFKRRGYIWKAIEQEEIMVENLPNRKGNLEEKWSFYWKMFCEHKIFPWSIISRKMPTRSYFGFVAKDSKGRKLPAVIMIESTESKFSSQKDRIIKNVLSFGDLQTWLEKYRRK